MDDLVDRIEGVIATIVEARAMPLSTSCVVNRSELVAELEAVRALIPPVCADAARIMAERDAILRRATRQAAHIVAEARRECQRLASDGAIVAAAEQEAMDRLAAARESADDMRSQIDQYVDHRLASFEDLLSRTLTSVARGRQRLAQTASDAPVPSSRIAGQRGGSVPGGERLAAVDPRAAEVSYEETVGSTWGTARAPGTAGWPVRDAAGHVRIRAGRTFDRAGSDAASAATPPRPAPATSPRPARAAADTTESEYADSGAGLVAAPNQLATGSAPSAGAPSVDVVEHARVGPAADRIP